VSSSRNWRSLSGARFNLLPLIVPPDRLCAAGYTASSSAPVGAHRGPGYRRTVHSFEVHHRPLSRGAESLDANLPTTTLGGGLTSDGPVGGWITVI
jgi:hypothetical protein